MCELPVCGCAYSGIGQCFKGCVKHVLVGVSVLWFRPTCEEEFVCVCVFIVVFADV